MSPQNKYNPNSEIYNYINIAGWWTENNYNKSRVKKYKKKLFSSEEPRNIQQLHFSSTDDRESKTMFP